MIIMHLNALKHTNVGWVFPIPRDKFGITDLTKEQDGEVSINLSYQNLPLILDT